MPVEEFKRCIHSDVKSFLDEREVDTLDVAARLADDYALTHKASFVNKPYKKPFNPQFKSNTPQSKPFNPQQRTNSPQPNPQPQAGQLTADNSSPSQNPKIPKIKILVKTKVKDPHTHPGCFAIIAKVTVTPLLKVKL